MQGQWKATRKERRSPKERHRNDDHTRMMWVYFIKYKFEAFECFKNLKALVENEKDSKIKCLRMDRGEFT